ncbi:hypothetical protein D3C81_1709010 [compost metagenome]
MMILRASTNRRSRSSCGMPWNHARSPPAEKARPAPVSTTASTLLSWAMSANTRDSSVCMSALVAFSDSGWLSVTVSTRPSWLNLMAWYFE